MGDLASVSGLVSRFDGGLNVVLAGGKAIWITLFAGRKI